MANGKPIAELGKTTRSRTRPTIVDVAHLAGVSQATATRAFSNDAPVAKKTRARVLAATQELGYRPNLLARGLRGKQTFSIGLVINSLGSPWITENRTDQIEREAWNSGYKLFIAAHRGLSDKQETCIHELLGFHVDGLLVTPAQKDGDGSLRQLIADGTPLVTIDSYYQLPACNVTVDREQGAYLQVEHLLQVGRQKLAFLVPGITNPRVQDRVRGYRRACADGGVDFDGQLTLLTDLPKQERFACGMELAREGLASGREFDGLVAMSDQVAFGAMMALTAAGKRIPEDVAVVGFADEPTARSWIPPLTTIHHPRNVGKAALDILVKQIKAAQESQAQTPPEPTMVVFEPHLVVRESTVKGQGVGKERENGS